MMENYVCASVCVVILSLFGCLDGIFERVCLRRTDVAYAALCVVALSMFRFRPVIEFDIDVASLVLPAAFALLAFDRRGEGAKTLATLSLVSMLPIAASALYMLYELYVTTYAFFSLKAEIVCLAQLGLCALTLIVASFKFAPQKAV